MAEDTPASGDTVDQSAIDDQHSETESEEQGSTGKSVSHQTYKKTVSEAKREREMRRQAEAKLKELEDQRLAESGNKDELIKRLQAKVDAGSKREKEIYGSFARKSVNQQIRSAALEAGAVDADVILSLADMSSLEIDPDTFEANGDEVKDLINGLKKSKGFLFQKAGPKLNGKLPSGQAVGSPKGPDFNSMKPPEIQKWLRENKHLFK